MPADHAPSIPSPPPRVWAVGAARSLTLDRSRIIAILNLTPDSFSDGGKLPTPADAAGAAAAALSAGADMLDLGAESTRPGASRVDSGEQLRRLLPSLRAIRAAGVEAPISVDTTLSAVAEAALDAGADAVNDVSAATEDPRMLALCAQRRAGIVLMHRLRAPDADRYSDQYASPPDYGDEAHGRGVVNVVRDFLRERADTALRAGVSAESIVLDPGLGFGKTVEQNFRLIASSAALLAPGYPLLGAASRKSFIGRAGAAQTPSDRVAGSIAASVAQRLGGVLLFRVHDVAAHAQALRVADAIAPETLAPIDGSCIKGV